MILLSMDKFEYQLERSPALTLFGNFYTYYYPALILNAALIIISISLLVNLNFHWTAIFYVLVLFFPFFLFIQLKFIRKGRRAMNKYCVMIVNKEKEEIQYETGFPNTTKRQLIKFNIDDVEKIIIKGSEFPGYFIEIERTSINEKLAGFATGKTRKRPEISRFGLWMDIADAKEFAQMLATAIGLKVIEEEFTTETIPE